MKMSKALRLALAALVVAGAGLLATGRVTLLTPDQAAYRAYQQENLDAAASTFRDPMWRGVALYKQGEFEQAANAFANLDTPEAAFNQGNALLLQGNYVDAAARYERALELRPDWQDAAKNREIALGRAARLELTGGEMTGGQLAADDYVFSTGDDSSSASGEEQTDGGEQFSEAENRALWLRQVQTRPADFLASKFAWQIAMRAEPAAEETE